MNNCWDVQNADSLTHGQGGDALGIVSMVNYTLNKYSGDAAKVYAMGGSSGAMMTNVLAGSYPDVFEAGAVFSGVARMYSHLDLGASDLDNYPSMPCEQQCFYAYFGIVSILH